MNLKLARSVLLAVSTLMTPPVLAAQSRHDTVMVQAGALRFVGTKVTGHGAIGIDTTARFAPTWSASLHTLPDAVAADSLSARMGQRGDFVKCENSRDYKTCAFSGVDAVVDLANIAFRADTAAVQLRLWDKPDAKFPIAMRFYSVLFVKNGATWEFVAARLTSQS